jgi:hypothetical protein
MPKFLRAIRFDASDLAVYAVPAEEGEWTVSGAFEFAGLEEGALIGKTRQAFANGFLAVPSFGRTTFATVATISDAELAAVGEALAQHLRERYDAPDAAAAAAVREELEFVADLCAEKPVNTVFAVVRRLDEAGNIREEFREILPSTAADHARIWDVEEGDD